MMHCPTDVAGVVSDIAIDELLPSGVIGSVVTHLTDHAIEVFQRLIEPRG